MSSLLSSSRFARVCCGISAPRGYLWLVSGAKPSLRKRLKSGKQFNYSLTENGKEFNYYLIGEPTLNPGWHMIPLAVIDAVRMADSVWRSEKGRDPSWEPSFDKVLTKPGKA